MADAGADFQDNVCSLLCQKFPAQFADQSEDRERLHRYGPALCRLRNHRTTSDPNARHAPKERMRAENAHNARASKRS